MSKKMIASRLANISGKADSISSCIGVSIKMNKDEMQLDKDEIFELKGNGPSSDLVEESSIEQPDIAFEQLMRALQANHLLVQRVERKSAKVSDVQWSNEDIKKTINEHVKDAIRLIDSRTYKSIQYINKNSQDLEKAVLGAIEREVRHSEDRMGQQVVNNKDLLSKDISALTDRLRDKEQSSRERFAGLESSIERIESRIEKHWDEMSLTRRELDNKRIGGGQFFATILVAVVSVVLTVVVMSKAG